MNSPRRLKNSRTVDISDLYALKLRAIWAAFRQEHLTLWMLCIYFFFEYVRPQTLYPAIDILPWSQIFLLASLVTLFTDSSVRWPGHGLNRLFVLFSIILVLSGVFAFRPSVSLASWEVFGGWFILYFLIISIVNTEKRLLLFMMMYCLFNLKMAQHGSLSWVMNGFSFTSYGLVGAPGWFRNSGEFAIQMLIYGSLAISIVVALKDHWGRYKKWFLYAAAISGFMSVMGASSRGAQLSLLVMIIWWVLKLKGGFRALLVIAVLAGLLFYLLPEEQIQRFQEMGEDESSLQRLSYWEYGLHEVIPRYPILGIGYQNWLDYAVFMVPEGMGPYRAVELPHNIYIQAAAEVGILGLAGFLALIIGAFVINAKTRAIAAAKCNRFVHYLSYGLDAGLIGYLIAGSFVSVLYYPFFWVQIAMIVMLNRVARTDL